VLRHMPDRCSCTDAYHNEDRDASSPVIEGGDVAAPWQFRRHKSAKDALPMSSTIDVKAFGATGDGVSDDTASVQQAFRAAAAHGGVVYIPPGIYRITSNLFLWGNVDVVGAGPPSILQLDADLISGHAYWICLGLPAIHGPTSPYSGYWKNLTIHATARAGAAHSFNVFGATNYGWIHCTFDFIAPGTTQNVGSIACQNNGNYTAGPYIRKNALIQGCTFLWNQSANAPARGGNAEGIGHGGTQGLRIIGNYVRGAGDDAIGVHVCDDVAIIGNQLFTIDGGIALSNVRRCLVANNHLQYVAGSDRRLASGMGIRALIESKDGPAPQDIEIVGNTIVYAANPHDSRDSGVGGYFVRLQGARNVNVVGNICLDQRPQEHPSAPQRRQIFVEATTVKDWSDPDGVEPDSTARVRNVCVANNTLMAVAGGCVGGAIVVSGASPPTVPGPVSIQHNIADEYHLSFQPADGGYVAGNVLGSTQSAAAFNIDGHIITDAAPIASWRLASVNANLTAHPLQLQGGAPLTGDWVAPARYAAAMFIVSATAPQTSGQLSVQMRVKGVNRASFGPATLSSQAAITYLSAPQVPLEQGDQVEFLVTTDVAFASVGAVGLAVDLYAVVV
jgi:hypothetical protein